MKKPIISARLACMAFIAVALLLSFRGEARALGPVPVDVVMAGDELYFVLEQPYEVGYLRVRAAPEKGKARPAGAPKALWLLGYDPSVKVNERKYLKLKQIKYGQKFAEFPRVEGPEKLQPNMKYTVEINFPGKFAREEFFIGDDGKAVMPSPAFERQKGRTYSVSTGSDGTKTLTPGAAATK